MSAVMNIETRSVYKPSASKPEENICFPGKNEKQTHKCKAIKSFIVLARMISRELLNYLFLQHCVTYTLGNKR